MAFDIASQKLKCQACGNVHDLAGSAQPVQERDVRATLASGMAGRVASQAQEKEIVCQSCGGHTTFTGSLTADRCPYCATPIQRDDVHNAPERLPVDAVVPFQVDAKQAKTLIESWIDSRWFAPSEFKTYNRTGSFSSVYMAYFTYDAETDTEYTGERGINRQVQVGSGDDTRWETRTDWYHVSGDVHNSFDDITVFANDDFDAKRIAKLEPWPTKEAKPYSPEFVAGHLCRTYDRGMDECLSDAKRTMESEITSTVRRDIGGDQQRVHQVRTDWRTLTYKHILLPIWLLTVIYQERPFQVFINGVTGEVQGQRPFSRVKLALAIAAGVVLLILIIVLVMAMKKKR